MSSSLTDRRKDRSKLRISTFNADYLFSDCGSHWKGCPWPDKMAAKVHLQNIARTIGALDADIVNICEVHSCHELTQLTELMKPHGYTSYLISAGTDHATGQNVGLLTRVDPAAALQRSSKRAAFPLPGSPCGYLGDPDTTGVSKHQLATFSLRVGGGSGKSGVSNGEGGGGGKSGVSNEEPDTAVWITLVGAHLVAQPTDPERCAKREAQAVVLRAALEPHLAAGREVILFGDLNDFDGGVVDSSGNQPSSRVLEILKGNVVPDGGSGIARQERYTDWWDRDGDCRVSGPGELSMLDHVLVTSGLRRAVTRATVVHSAYGAACTNSTRFVSDHWPVLVEIDL
ncbi:unnamed protein product, partial [Phaeothamnion confervicola]